MLNLLHRAIEQLQTGENTLFLKLQQARKVSYSKSHDDFFGIVKEKVSTEVEIQL